MKKAAIIAINNYPGTSNDLRGCLNDAADALATLKAKGFACTTYYDAKATKAQILAGMKAAFTCARSGDSVAIVYSAHGSQVRDSSGDESDGRDEVLCPADWPQYVSDDDIRAILATVPLPAKGSKTISTSVSRDYE